MKLTNEIEKKKIYFLDLKKEHISTINKKMLSHI